MALVFLDGVGDVLDQPLLVEFPQPPLTLGVGPAVPHHFIAALADAFEDFRVVVIQQAVDQTRGRQLEFIE